jgi:predicted lipoprotein with Yx(FWY)xxD motif
MRRVLLLLSPTLAASLTLAACGGSGSGGGSSSSAATTPSSAAPASASGAVVRTASSASLGSTVLTDAQGRTLYSLSVEQNGKFICTSGSCTQIWHPLTAPSSGTPSGAASLGTVMRPDGTRQVTYKGLPLYTFAQDQPGEAKGQGLKDVGTWSAVTVTPSAAPAAGASTTSSTPSTTSSTPATTSSTPATTSPTPATGGRSGY